MENKFCATCKYWEIILGPSQTVEDFSYGKCRVYDVKIPFFCCLTYETDITHKHDGADCDCYEYDNPNMGN